MKRTSQSGPPRGGERGPRGGGPASTRPSSRGRDDRAPRPRDERSTRGRAATDSRDEGASRPRGERASRPRGERASRPRDERPARPRDERPARPAPRASTPDSLLARQPWASLRPHLPGTPGEVEARLAALRAYARQLLEWNRGVSNLVSRHDEPRIVERHLLESVIPARAIGEFGCRRFVDFGSGAGLPAVPLAICGIGEHWTLVESRRNKTLFLRKLKQDKVLERADVRTARLEALVEEDAAGLACDAFTSRATAAIGPTLDLAASIVSGGGRAFLWKGSSYEQELEAAGDGWSATWRLDRVIPIGEGPNVVAIFIRL